MDRPTKSQMVKFMRSGMGQVSKEVRYLVAGRVKEIDPGLILVNDQGGNEEVQLAIGACPDEIVQEIFNMIKNHIDRRTTVEE